MRQEFRLKEIDETINYFIEEIMENDLISRKHKKVCKILNFTKHLLILASTVTGSVSISNISSLVCTPVSVASSAAIIKNFCNNCRN